MKPWIWTGLTMGGFFSFGPAAHGEAALPEAAQPITLESAYQETATPAGYLFRLKELAEPKWQDLISEKPPLQQTDRCDSAFGLGVALANAYLAVETMDAQLLRNCGQEVQLYAQPLGLGHLCQTTWNDLVRMGETKDWAMLRTQMDSAFALVKDRLTMQQDLDLALLVEIGVWFRLYEAGCDALLKLDKIPSDPCSLIPCGKQKETLLAKLAECEKIRKNCPLLARLARIFDGLPDQLQSDDVIYAGIVSFRDEIRAELSKLRQN